MFIFSVESKEVFLTKPKWATRVLLAMEKEVEEMLEGVVMFTTSILGILLNISSIFYFARYNHQRAFHR
jgi:hypothetical protein